MATYETRQKKDLIDFLTRHSDQALTIDAIAEGMKSDPAVDKAPGKSTVYRLIPKLCEENIIKCFSEGGRTTYQLTGGKHCSHHMHMKCTSCGRLIHMSDEESHRLISRISAFSQFKVDMRQTLLFGQCRGCMNVNEGMKGV